MMCFSYPFFMFAGDHPFAATIMVIAVLMAIKGIIYAFINQPFRFYNRTMRHLTIRKCGWPANPLMDADGDIVHPESSEE